MELSPNQLCEGEEGSNYAVDTVINILADFIAVLFSLKPFALSASNR